jgi:hypothetical protein
VHYRNHVESWPGGFHRNPKEDEAVLARNPLPSDRLELREFRVAGHQVSYQGRLVVAFCPGPNHSLSAFGGYQCQAITLDGVEHPFADAVMDHLAWAPVAENRRVPGGAIMEIWATGEATLRIPLPDGKGSRLFRHGARPGVLGEEVKMSIENHHVVFQVKRAEPIKTFYLL